MNLFLLNSLSLTLWVNIGRNENAPQRRHQGPELLLRFQCLASSQSGRLLLGAVHILRQPPEGGGGVSQKLTIADEGVR